MKLKENSGGNFIPCPEYTGKAVCVDVTPLKKVQTQYGEQEKFKLVFEVDLPREDGGRHCVWSRGFTPSLHEKSGFRKFLRGWFGRDLTKEECAEFDTESCLGKSAFLVVTHETKGEEVYANIASCTPDRTGSPLAPSGKFVRAQDRQPKDGSGGGDYRRVEQAAPAAASAPQDPAVVHGSCKVHVGKCKGLELRDMNNEQVEALVKNWLPASKANPRQSADDKRLISALEWFQSLTAAAKPAEDDVNY